MNGSKTGGKRRAQLNRSGDKPFARNEIFYDLRDTKPSEATKGDIEREGENCGKYW